MEIRAFAKINLFLEVTGRRPDGYHDLVTVMQTVSLCDTLTLRPVSGEGVRLLASSDVPQGQDNLAVRAAEAYFAAAGRRFGLEIELEKRIPMAAGLGGGSADAAAVLRGCNALDGDRFSIDTLCEIGAKLGADVPFCVVGGTRLCRGIGEVMTPTDNRLGGALVVAVDGEGVSTPRAFAALDAVHGDFAAPPKRDVAPLLAALATGDVSAAGQNIFNRFEEVTEPERPRVTALKAALRAHGARNAMMSGTGPSVWGLFGDIDAANAAAAALTADGVRAFACTFR